MLSEAHADRRAIEGPGSFWHFDTIGPPTHDLQMTTGKLLCLNMIVKNEVANLERCLGAVADHIACWVIGDTGSTDETQDFMHSFFAARKIPGELHSFPFENFEQARNAALDCAYASALNYDYLLFADADMELVVVDRNFRERLEAPGYRLLQRAGSGLAYWNTRLVQRNAGARYHGVTHEYIDVPGGVKELRGVWYKDHASGSNRAEKFERDIKLLTNALEKEPENRRYWFYLAQSYRDAGRTAEAAKAYAKRAEMGGWDEESWNARLQEARCLRKLGDEGGFLRQALAAFNQRPQRAEPLYDLARYYREKRMHEASLLFSERALGIRRPEDDTLFLEEFVYTAGLQEEYSIAANYARDPARKDRGFAACNWLALNREIPRGSRDLARSNLFFYLQSANTMMPSFAARPVGFAPPEGYRPMQPSITRQGEQIVLVQPTVNYTVTDDGQYHTRNEEPIHTRNFLLRLSSELVIHSTTEVLPPVDMTQPEYSRVLGFADLRLFTWRDELWASACIRELTPQGWCEQVLARIDQGSEECRLRDWRPLHPGGPRRHEKNWIPRVIGEKLQFIQSCDPTRVLDEQAATIFTSTPPIAAEQFGGGSQAIAFDRGWLALIHEVQSRVSDQKKCYHQHRFAWFEQAGTLRLVSRPFFFHKKGIEFAAGLAWFPDGKRLLISYGTGDQDAWIATVDAMEVRGLLEDVERLPSGALDAGGGKVALKLGSGISGNAVATAPKTVAATWPPALDKMQPRTRWCVFTSAGDNNNVLSWLPRFGARDWDLIIAFYGDDESVFRQLQPHSTVAYRVKGSKWQNLKKLYDEQPAILSNYEYIWITDDDMIFHRGDVRRMFELASTYDLWVSQPAFSGEGRISHEVTRWQGLNSGIRLVNFVEVTCPIFRVDKLVHFLNAYDGHLVGWGIDWWYGSLLGANQVRKFGVLEEIVVINPHDHQRPGRSREIIKLQSNEERRQHWYNTKTRLGMSEYDTKTFATITYEAYKRAADPATMRFGRNGVDPISDLIRDFPQKDFRIIFDVGASTGQLASQYSQQFPLAKIICFEPVETTFMSLSDRVRSLPNVHAFCLGLGAESSRRTITVMGNSTMNRMTREVAVSPGINAQSIQIETLEQWCKENDVAHIDLLKIDTEGSDLEVLKGADKMLNKIDFIQCKVSANRYNKCHAWYEVISDYLFEREFYLYGIYEQFGEWTGGGYPILRRFNPVFVNVNMIGPLRGLKAQLSKDVAQVKISSNLRT
jgi:FkbM family methyltransferase